MAIHTLADVAAPVTSVSATVCVVGAGVAGLVAAARLASDPRVRVVVIESGVDGIADAATQALDLIDNPAGNYEGNLRDRRLGGTSASWDGKLLPISRSDTSERPWVSQQPWPFDVAELDRYTDDLEKMMGVDSASYEEDAAPLLDPDRLLPRNDSEFVQRWPKRPSPADLNTADVLREQITSWPNIDIWLGATASTFDFDGNDRLTSIVAVDHFGHSLTVTADEFLIAAGALESTRLLLVADRQSGGVITRESDALGRYFNDHFGLNVATVRPKNWRRANAAFADRWTLGASRHLHFELRPTVQQESRTASAYFDFGVTLPDSSALTQIRSALDSARGRRPAAVANLLRYGLAGIPDLARTAWGRYGIKKKYWPSDAVVEVKVWIEQLPEWNNRLVLSDTADALGQPRLRCELTKTDADESTLRQAVVKIRGFWNRHLSDIADLEWIPEVDDPNVRLVDLAVQLAHPAGATRMGTDPGSSVVDTSLRVHAVPNLAIASSSVFPTSGSANPTFMIIQLAMRAADALAQRIQSGRAVHNSRPGE
ncbi:GMC oxidoreductase [Mycobacterium sp. NBC_00419]|uniref:GMC family oxidoreductase n=1 Tax=Mycobacterium sp. NBC_00419 TaxID=2975989 RepID=UPI002E1F1A75